MLKNIGTGAPFALKELHKSLQMLSTNKAHANVPFLCTGLFEHTSNTHIPDAHSMAQGNEVLLKRGTETSGSFF